MGKNYYTYGTNLQNREFFTSTVRTEYGTKRYFSNIESEIYFGNQLMEDIFKFDFVVEEKKAPLYGYNCFHADIIVPGQRIVQGSFVLNFTNTQLMSKVLSKIDDSILYNKVVECENYNPSGSERDRALWSKNFDITIGYGYYKKDEETYSATCQTICGVQITNMQTILDTSGEPIMEAYSFIAKDYIDNNAVDNLSSTEEESPNEGNNGNQQKSFIYADRNNEEDYANKYNEHKNNKDAICLVHDIVFTNMTDARRLVVVINDFEFNFEKYGNVSLVIDEQLDHNFITYKLKKENDNTFTYDFAKSIEDGNTLYKAFKSEDISKASCSLKYELKIKDETYPIKYDGYVYPRIK